MSSHSESHTSASAKDQIKFAQTSPFRGYLEAHDSVQNPLGILGGSTKVTIQQDSGDVHVALPDYRKLDPDVFGTPEYPLAYGGTPVAEGIPPGLRKAQMGHFTELKQKTPFGHANFTLRHGHLNLTLLDATATDAAHSDDTVQLDASWQDEQGNTYEVRCHKVYPHGDMNGHPTFGGVLLNHLMHGSSRIGTPLEPTLFSYAAFWGPGEVLKNGKVLDSGRLVHCMLTESVRGKNYSLDFDNQVDPTHLLLHLIVPPMKKGEPTPVKTGYTLANGKDLPFWHVMFNNFHTEATHQQMAASFPAAPQQAQK